jgi:hypothetical protein
MAAPAKLVSKAAEERRRGGDSMLRHKMLAISSDPAMRRSLKRLMTATGALTDFIANLSQLPAEPPSLIAVDLRSQEAPQLKDLEKVFPEKRLICIVGVQDFAQIVECLKQQRCSNVITYDDRFEPDDFIITVTKMLHGQVFGLQKYFPWGVTVYNMDVSGYEEKVRALDVLTKYAELAGARGAVRDRMALVAEELIINGMYHAPVDEHGAPRYRHLPRKEVAKLQFDRPVKVACASNGQHFAIAVRDSYGSLDKQTIVKFLAKGAESILEPEQQREQGAGLGLVTALKSASKLVFNLAPGVGTEVIALFDMDLLSKGHQGVRAVHIFTDRRKLQPASERATNLSRPSLMPLLAGALAVVLIIFGVVGVMRKLNEQPPTVHAEFTVGDGQMQAVPVQIGASEVKLKVERKGSNIVIQSEP